MTKIFFSVLVTTLFSVSVSVSASAAGDCVYRFSQSQGELQVIPSGFTGQMTCKRAEIKKLLATVTKEVSAQLDKEKAVSGSGMLPSITVRLGNLSFYPSLRAEIAKSLKEDAGWDKATGKAKADAFNNPVAAAFLRSSFVQAMTQKNLLVDESGIENIKTAPASELKISGLKTGIYPQAGELKLVLHKEVPRPPPSASPAKKVEGTEDDLSGL